MDMVPQEEIKVLCASVEVILVRFAHRASESVGDFGLVEEAARVAILHMREALMSSGVRLSAAQSRAARHCPICSASLSEWSRDERRIVTAQGEATYRPIRYRCCACKEDYYPLEEANGLHGSSYTTGAKAVIAEASAEQPFTRVAHSLSEERGLCVSAKEVDRTMRDVAQWRAEEESELVGSVYGQAAAQLRAQGHDPLAEAPSLHGFGSWPAGAAALLSVDGGMVRSTFKGPKGLEWFECRAGLLRTVDGSTQTTPFHTAGVCSPDALFDQLGACWKKVVPAGCCCVFVADGARWIWDRVRLYFPNAVQVLDYYHACEHVGSVAAALFGERTAQTNAWAQYAKKKLLDPGGAVAIVRELLRVMRDPKNVADPQALRTDARYLLGHRHRMRYHKVKSQGLPIGSGAMESAIKQLTAARLRMPGMKWTREGADAILRVRAAHLSNSLRDTTMRKNNHLQNTTTNRYRNQEAIAA